MKPVEGLIGPGISPNDLNVELPSCVHIDSPADGDEIKAFLDRIVRAASGNAARVLREMLAKTPGAAQLAAEFAARLGV